MARLSAHAIQGILAQHPGYDGLAYIETGLWKGDQIAIAKDIFRVVHGIELDDYWHAVNRDRWSACDHVRIHHGDSRVVLPSVLDAIDGPVFFYLDAHYCKIDPPIANDAGFPLWDELAIIRDRGQRDIVIVDDVHTFGVERPDIGMTEWVGVTAETVREFFGARLLDSEIVEDSFAVWLP